MIKKGDNFALWIFPNFLEAINELPNNQRADVWRAVCEFGLGQEIDIKKFKNAQKMCIKMLIPLLKLRNTGGSLKKGETRNPTGKNQFEGVNHCKIKKYEDNPQDNPYPNPQDNPFITGTRTGTGNKTNKSSLNSDLSVEVANRLADLITQKKAIKIHAQQKTSWAKEIDLLQKRDGVSDERIKKAIGWYEENAGGQYVPVIESGKAFREKFIKLEDAIKRSPASAESEIYIRHGIEYRGQEALYWKSVDADREAYNGRA